MNYNSNDFLYDLFHSDHVWDAAYNTAIIAWSIAVPIAFMCLFISLGFTYLWQSLKGWEWRELLSKLGINVGILAILLAYPIMMNPIIGLMRVCADQTAPTLENKVKYFEELDKKYEKERQEKYDKTGMTGDVVQAGKETINTVSNLSQVMLVGAVDSAVLFVLGIAEAVIFTFSLFTMYAFYIIGPLALAFSILPMFRDKANIWLGTLLTAGFNLTTLNLLDHFFWNVTIGQVTAALNFQHVNSYVVIVINVVIIVLYFCSFWFTSRFVGSESAGKILSGAVTGAATAAGYIGGLGAAASGAAGGSSGGLTDNVAKTARKSIQITDDE